jgi:hypothetical protein
MSTLKKPPGTSSPPSKEDRLAKALRENLARRKALMRAKRASAEGAASTPDRNAGAGDDEQPS